MHRCESLHVESVALKEVFEGQTVSTQMNTIILWAMYGTAIAVMANLIAFLTYLLLNDQDDWGKQLMITAKARIRAWKSRSHRMSVATFRFIAKRNALTHGVIARQSKQDVRCTRNSASRFAGADCGRSTKDPFTFPGNIHYETSRDSQVEFSQAGNVYHRRLKRLNQKSREFSGWSQ
jgi:hypothetical protein